eukprot:8985286-Alexandrium_andersonii.AAC.1
MGFAGGRDEAPSLRVHRHGGRGRQLPYHQGFRHPLLGLGREREGLLTATTSFPLGRCQLPRP